jgi:hypothetical protein
MKRVLGVLLLCVAMPAAAAPGDMYGAVGNGGGAARGTVLIVDQTNAVSVALGTPVPGQGLTGIAFSNSGRLYGSTISGTPKTSSLVEIDPLTGLLVSTIGPILAGGNPISIGDLAVQPGTGTLYGVRANSDGGVRGGEIYTISLTTAAATLLGRPENTNGGLAFAPDGTLYLMDNERNILTLNPVDGSILTTTATTRFLDGLAVRSDGVVFGTAPGAGATNILTINPMTGAQSTVGASGFSQSDLAFSPPEGGCCTDGPGTDSDCIVTTQGECERDGGLFLGNDTECTMDLDCTVLLVTMGSMSATATSEGVVISWTTTTEVDTVGFRVLREESAGREKRIALISPLIPANGNSFTGASYQFLDNSRKSATAIRYYIEEIDAFGRTTRFGAIQVDRGMRQLTRTR